MNVILAFLVLSSPFAIAALLSWSTHRNDAVHASLLKEYGDRDYYRVWHDVEAARTRFERNPSWPASGVTGERR
ncbi:MAG: hypothetical protein QOI01_1115 [Mycobacterium sp.]|jgi:hypothetical protein|nr:hypothetical protein [Mycobacterium sp.]